MTEYTPPQMRNKSFRILAIIVIIGCILAYFAVFHPSVFTTILNFFWVFMLITVAVFLVLGILVMVGLKKEVSSFLDVLLEGSLSIIDAIEFIKKIYHKFVDLLKDFVYFITPIIAIWIAVMIYVGIMFLYKGVGKENDVTLLTTIVAIVMVVAVGVLNQPEKDQLVTDTDLEEQPEIVSDTEIVFKADVTPDKETTWHDAVQKRFKHYFADSFEVVVFVFFLTMDMVNIFFLPKDLQVPLRAAIGDYDLMLRGVNISTQLTATVYLVTLGISVEIIRNIIKLVSVSIVHYNLLPRDKGRPTNIKIALRQGLTDSKDDLLRFMTFTTTLILVFLIFPRLKLFAMLISSITGLVLDFIIPGRRVMRKGNDLISRILNKIFRI